MLNENGIKIWVSCCGVSQLDLIANDTAKELVTHSLICTCNCEECTYVSQLLGKNLRLTGNEILEQERKSGRYEKYSKNLDEDLSIVKCEICEKNIREGKIYGGGGDTFCSPKCWKISKDIKYVNNIFFLV